MDPDPSQTAACRHDSLLEAEGLTVHYGGSRALDGVDLSVGRGELVALIGPNGAGKTTLLDALTGFTPSMGTVRLDGRDISNLEPHARNRRGLTRTFQAADLFVDLSVRENLRVASAKRTGLRELSTIFVSKRQDPPEIQDAMELLGIEGLAGAMPEELTVGQLKLVGVARALAGSPRVLCLDEPAAGLTTSESIELGQRLRRIVDSGIAILLIDHDMGLVLRVSDHVVVLDFGQVISSGRPDTVRDDPRVIEAYLGTAGASAPEPVTSS